MSVDLSITMTAAVPRPDCTSLRESKSILQLVNIERGNTRRSRRCVWVELELMILQE